MIESAANGNDQYGEKGYLSLHLHAAETASLPEGWQCKATFAHMVVNQNEMPIQELMHLSQGQGKVRALLVFAWTLLQSNLIRSDGFIKTWRLSKTFSLLAISAFRVSLLVLPTSTSLAPAKSHMCCFDAALCTCLHVSKSPMQPLIVLNRFPEHL